MVNKKMGRVGELIVGDRPSVFELVIDDHILHVDPNKFGVECESINPKDYFVTSGDAVEKAKALERELWQLAGRVRGGCCTKGGKKAVGKYEKAIWKEAGQARSMVNKLKEARDDACFLETEWDRHKLLCIPKNPRG
jgi:hypothetical protein